MNTSISKPPIQKNVNLAPFNTLGVEATAAQFLTISESSQLLGLFREGFFKKNDPVILGGGSNVLIKSDLNQPVLKISIPGIEVLNEKEDEVLINSGAGVIWHDLVSYCVDHDFGGIENLALIPGTVGAAPIQNIGAYGVELKDTFHSLKAFIPATGEQKEFSKKECEFGYRDSIFKNSLKGEVIITEVTLRLQKSPHQIEDSYYALREYFQTNGVTEPSIKDVFDAVVTIRESKLPNPELIGNAGSFFKNPIVERSIYQKIKAEYSEMPSFEAGDGKIKIPAGWLIEQAGWKGKKVGNVGTYKNQALVLVNHGGATGEEIYQHAMNISESVKEKFGIELAPEVNVIS
ncbi:UDP-N-acetylmuramate dehydrogenase [Rhodohalobacter sp.]|uniref:UDP-N-acetylmuramate dehydrogenase n=1 Tax=Rhodohalobacter sp. TaxID=1974210 RepID=UPI002ACEFA6E|nr:UDP-N-acetylmuramate dehydrogenase [Rhodohalobacter sp.]MDZ7755321.1 UDP-N-acetylmuramate dehydrogenase [Rhodohalobacter sp.]